MLLRFNRKSAAITDGGHADAIEGAAKSPTGYAEHTPAKRIDAASPGGEVERVEVKPRQSLRRKAAS